MGAHESAPASGTNGDKNGYMEKSANATDFVVRKNPQRVNVALDPAQK
jgi:hypothetical protein